MLGLASGVDELGSLEAVEPVEEDDERPDGAETVEDIVGGEVE